MRNRNRNQISKKKYHQSKMMNERSNKSKKKKRKRRKKKPKANSTRCSRAVTHHSTNQARLRLTSVIGREPVHSQWYDRWRKLEHTLAFILSPINDLENWSA
jgi:hypothetical protein